MDRIFGFFLEEPRRLVGLGKAVFTAGALLLVFGLLGGVARLVTAGGPAKTTKSLAELYPEFWTWWIPETLLGAVPALIVVAAGIWLTMLGRRFLRAGF